MEHLGVDVGADRSEQFDLLDGVGVRPPLLLLGLGRGDDLLGRLARTAGGAGVADEAVVLPVDDAAEVAGDAHRPGDRGGLEVELGLELVDQFERLSAGTIPLVDEADDRQLTLATHLEQLAGLALDAARRVEHHDHRVDRGKDPVGVLGEVAVTGRVEQVQDVVAIGELEHGRGDRDAPLLLHLHPVRADLASLTAGLDVAGLLDRPAVEQELLGERRLAGIGVADDGEGPPPRSFFGRRAHPHSVTREGRTTNSTPKPPIFVAGSPIGASDEDQGRGSSMVRVGARCSTKRRSWLMTTIVPA